MIGACANDLFEKISAASGFAGKVGLHLLGAEIDPSASRIPLPAVAIVLGYLEPTEPAGFTPSRNRTFNACYSVRLLTPNTSQADLVAVQYPLLEQVIQAVQGTDTPSSSKWTCEGAALDFLNPDRLCYEFKFETIISI